MIKAIIFDFYDVIHGDPYKRWLESRGLKREGIYHELSYDLDVGKIDVDQFIEELSRLSSETPVSILKEFDEVAKVDADMVDLIDKLHKKYRTALLSNSPGEILRSRLLKYDLERRFDEIVISGEVGYAKPSKEIFQIILDRLKIEPSEAIFIDDSKSHVDGAEKVGIKSIQYTSMPVLLNDLNKLGIVMP
jgi:epoxide hydrolase-like predicted phosphatase